MRIGTAVLNGVEKFGNKLPDPVFIFLGLVFGLIGLSAWGAAAGWAAVNPVSGERIVVESLVSGTNLQRIFVEMPRTVTSFPALGPVLVLVLGTAVAERAGLFSAAIRGSLARAPKALLTPLVAIVGMVSHHASDAAYVVLIPLAAVIFAAAGRHPLAGLAAGFAAVSGGWAGNITPGQSDALILGITEPAARIIDPTYTVSIAGNWYYILGVVVVFTPLIWFITDRIVEPRLGTWTPAADAPTLGDADRLTGVEKRGLWFALAAAVALAAAWAWLTFGPLQAFVDADADPEEAYNPLFRSLVAFFALLFFLCGAAYGIGARAIRSHRDLVRMMSQGVVVLAPYIVLVFFAAHFITLFTWSNLGQVMAVGGADYLRSVDLPAPALLVVVVLVSSGLDLFIGSASAKWAALAPVVVPMFMLLGISPEMTTAAYRMGDSYTNIVTPLMSYFPLILTFAQRWRGDFGVGSMFALMIPYALAFMIFGIGMTAAWVALDLPVGPGAPVHYALPPAAAG
jgi:aminobenzoyl-glutamate transport protein